MSDARHEAVRAADRLLEEAGLTSYTDAVHVLRRLNRAADAAAMLDDAAVNLELAEAQGSADFRLGRTIEGA